MDKTPAERFISGELSEIEFESEVLANSDWDGNKPSDHYYILLQAYREVTRILKRPNT
jgi:hypothetical protein